MPVSRDEIAAKGHEFFEGLMAAMILDRRWLEALLVGPAKVMGWKFRDGAIGDLRNMVKCLCRDLEMIRGERSDMLARIHALECEARELRRMIDDLTPGVGEK